MEQLTGKMSLIFRKRADGKTHLANQYFKLPLQVMPPHYQDQDGTAFVYLLNPSGGILQHDRLLTEVTAEEDSKVFITTPSNTKFYKMDDGYAKIVNRLTVKEGAVMEYLPEHNVPFANSKAYQENDFYLAKDSIFIASDMVAAGRVSRGEIFDYDVYSSRTRIYVDGKLAVYDNSHIEPKKMGIKETGMMEGYLSTGTVYVYAPQADEELAQNLNRHLQSETVGRFAAGMLEKNLMMIRFLDHNIMDLQQTVLDVWGYLRKNILGKPAVRIRKY